MCTVGFPRTATDGLPRRPVRSSTAAAEPGVHPVRPRDGRCADGGGDPGRTVAGRARRTRPAGRSQIRYPAGTPCGDAAVLLVSGLSGISVRSPGREAGGDWGCGWQRPYPCGRAGGGGQAEGDPARARRERYLCPAADLAFTRCR